MSYGRVRRVRGETLLAFNRRAHRAYLDEWKHEKVSRGEWQAPAAYAATTGRLGASLDRFGRTLLSASQRVATLSATTRSAPVPLPAPTSRGRRR